MYSFLNLLDVWKYLLPKLHNILGNNLIYISRHNYDITNEITNKITTIQFNNNLDNTVQSIVNQHLDKVIVFFSTYYEYPKINNICNVLMYHDLIPENVYPFFILINLDG